MSNDVTTTRPSALASVTALKANLRRARTSVPTVGTEGILSYRKGDWTFGVDDKIVSPDDIFAVNPLSIYTGYVCWYDAGPRGELDPRNKKGPIDEIRVPLGGDPVQKSTLTAPEGASWVDQAGFSFKFVEGEFKGREGRFSTTSVGGLNAMGDLMDKIANQVDEDGDNPVPVISPNSGSYPNKKYGGTTHFPILDIEEWIGMDGAASVEEDEPPHEGPPAEEPAKPARTRTAKAEPEPEPEVEEPAATATPARRRRRA